MADYHMRWSAVSAAKGGLITEIAWNPGQLEVIGKWQNRCICFQE